MLTRHLLHFYPEIGDGPVSEVWHAGKWCTWMPYEHLTPMFVHPENGIHFYVNELAMLANQSYVIPLRWIVVNKVLCGDVYELCRSESDQV